jgi:hypothetical protein
MKRVTGMEYRAVMITALFSLFLLGVLPPAYAGQTVKDLLSNHQPTGDVCGAVKDAIAQGFDAKDVVKTGIEIDGAACLVIKCAIMKGADLTKVIMGAVEGGATSDVVSRCAMDAGATASDVGMNLKLAGLALDYMPSDDPFQSIPAVPDPPRPVSQSGF